MCNYYRIPSAIAFFFFAAAFKVFGSSTPSFVRVGLEAVISYDVYSYHGGSPPYRGWKHSERLSLSIPLASTIGDLVKRLDGIHNAEKIRDVNYEIITRCAHPACEADISTDNNVLEKILPTDSRTIESVLGVDNRHLRAKVGWEFGSTDIGVFSLPDVTSAGGFLATSIASDVSVALSAEAIDVVGLVNLLGGDPHANFSVSPSLDSIDESHLLALKGVVEERFLAATAAVAAAAVTSNAADADLSDFKVWLEPKELASFIGEEGLRELESALGGPADDIILRRSEAQGKVINFHTDYSKKTLQVSLSSESEYRGGRLIYAAHGMLMSPARSVGTITVHSDDIVHGVSALYEGVRYGLFLLQKSKQGIVSI